MPVAVTRPRPLRPEAPPSDVKNANDECFPALRSPHNVDASRRQLTLPEPAHQITATAHGNVAPGTSDVKTLLLAIVQHSTLKPQIDHSSRLRSASWHKPSLPSSPTCAPTRHRSGSAGSLPLSSPCSVLLPRSGGPAGRSTT